MTTIDEMLEWRKKNVWDVLDQMARDKGRDYSGANRQGDTFKNIRLIEFLTDGQMTADIGLVYRLADKFSRIVMLLTNEFLKSLGLKASSPAIKEESIEDTIRDMINYLSYELVIRADRKMEGKGALE